MQRLLPYVSSIDTDRINNHAEQQINQRRNGFESMQETTNRIWFMNLSCQTISNHPQSSFHKSDGAIPLFQRSQKIGKTSMAAHVARRKKRDYQFSQPNHDKTFLAFFTDCNSTSHTCCRTKDCNLPLVASRQIMIKENRCEFKTVRLRWVLLRHHGILALRTLQVLRQFLLLTRHCCIPLHLVQGDGCGCVSVGRQCLGVVE